MTTDSQHTALYSGMVFGLLAGRTLIEVAGNDRQSFLHNLCTADIKSLQAGAGCEAFFTNVQGKTLCHALLLCMPESIWISTDPGMAEQLLPHLDKYLIREDVQLTDKTKELQTLLVAGPDCQASVKDCLGVDLQEVLQHQASDVGDVTVAKVPFAAPFGFFVIGASDQVDAVTAKLGAAGGQSAGEETLELARIEAAFPSTGREVTLENLPQEIDRDQLAISFTKGCYLGQETVARIDALGRVNKLLVALQFDGAEVPEVGLELKSADKVVGHVTSSCYSPKEESAIGLGIVRREAIEKAAPLECEIGSVRVVA